MVPAATIHLSVSESNSLISSQLTAAEQNYNINETDYGVEISEQQTESMKRRNMRERSTTPRRTLQIEVTLYTLPKLCFLFRVSHRQLHQPSVPTVLWRLTARF